MSQYYWAIQLIGTTRAENNQLIQGILYFADSLPDFSAIHAAYPWFHTQVATQIALYFADSLPDFSAIHAAYPWFSAGVATHIASCNAVMAPY